MAKYCNNCGKENTDETKFCMYCGTKIGEDTYSSNTDFKRSETTNFQDSSQYYQPRTPTYQPASQSYKTQWVPRSQHQVASCGDRLIGYVVDYAISSIGLGCLCYDAWKDGIREGQSFGKGLVNLRVLNYNTGLPATIGDSMMRNCGESIAAFCTCGLTGCLSLYWLSTDPEKRRMGDRIANTIVIKDM